MAKVPRYRFRILLICAILGIGTYQLYSFMVHLIDETHYARERLEVANQVGRLRLALEQHLNSAFYVSRGLEMLISGLTADGSRLSDHWGAVRSWAAKVSADVPEVMNVALSDGYVVKFSYPLQRNKKVIGLDYRDLKAQWPAVERAIRTRHPVVAGPLNLIQGGKGILCRVPLFANRLDGGSNPFIGIVTIVINYNKLLENTGLLAAQKKLNLAIRGKDGLGANGAVFLGSEDVFKQEDIQQNINFLGGTWVIAAKPKAGWSHESPYSRNLRILGYVLCVFGVILAYFALTGLQQRREAVYRFTRELESRVEERTQQLSSAKDQAERANRAKSEFLAVVTHELRTPLNSIIGLTDLILAMSLGDKQRELLRKVSISAGLQLELINNILSYAKMESGKEDLNSTPFSLSVLCKKIADLFEVTAVNNGIEFSVEIMPGTPELLEGDEAKIIQVLINLCGNAIKFTREGYIQVSVEPIGEDHPPAGNATLRFTVTDTGIGIEEHSQQMLFKPFSQVDSGMTRKYQGTGLGLSISKSFVELMGGVIGVESRLGGGSRFWFEIPLRVLTRMPPSATETAVLQTDQLVERAKVALGGATLILAEDNEFNQILAVSLLEKAGIHVKVAANGLEVLKLLQQGPVHGILMDIQMPEMDGVTTAGRIRGDSACTTLPIIALTANAMEEDRQQVLAAGMNDFIAKPIKPVQFYRVLLERIDSEVAYTASSTGESPPVG